MEDAMEEEIQEETTRLEGYEGSQGTMDSWDDDPSQETGTEEEPSGFTAAVRTMFLGGIANSSKTNPGVNTVTPYVNRQTDSPTASTRGGRGGSAEWPLG